MIFDGHSDLFMALYERHERGEIDIIDKYADQMRQSNMIGGIFVVFLDNARRYYENFEEMFNIALKEIKNSINFMLVKDSSDLLKQTNKIKVIMGAESLMPLQYDISMLEEFYKKGLRHAMLTWNEENELATGVRGDRFTGLTEKGIQYLDKMQELNMIIDLSHLNERSFNDVLDHINTPVICSHSNCRSICDHPRNLTDKQILRIKENKGLISVTAVPSFVSSNPGRQTIDGLIDHIDHLVDLIGIDHVGLGFDYMGFYESNEGNLNDLYNFSHSVKIIDALIFRGYTKDEIEKITHLNYLRFIERNFDKE